MTAFQYPLDAKLLLRKKKSIRKELLASGSGFTEKRIAVLGGSTTNEIVDQMELFLLNYGIKPTFYQSEYARYWQDAMFGNEELDAFNPDVIYVHTNWRNISLFPTTTTSPQDIDEMLTSEFHRFSSMCPELERASFRPSSFPA